MPDAISGIKLVWDLLTGLVRGYETGKKELFNSHIEPLHQRMLAIHKDYLAGFQEVKRHLENNETPPSEIIEFLEQRRRDYVAERDLVEKLAEELASAERRLVRDEVWTNLREYCRAVINYFSAACEIGGISWYTDFLHSVKAKTNAGFTDVWSSLAISGNARRDLLKQVRDVLDVGLPRALGPINTYYAVLRSRLL